MKKRRSSSVSTGDDTFSGKSIEKAKLIKDKFPGARFGDIFDFVAKQGPNVSVENLINSY